MKDGNGCHCCCMVNTHTAIAFVLRPVQVTLSAQVRAPGPLGYVALANGSILCSSSAGWPSAADLMAMESTSRVPGN